jgi:TonB family protein
MLLNLLFVAAAFAATESGTANNQSVQSKDSEFIFSQYPPRALAAGEQGAVKFRVEIDETGRVQGCKVTGSSGFKRLDDETCDLIVEHATFKPVLDSEGKAREAIHDGVVNWRIPGAPAAAKVASSGGQGPDKVICKRVQKTGSLVSSSRTCMTAREWSQQADQYQDEYGAIQGRQGSSRGN